MASTYPAALDTLPTDITDDTDSQAGTPRTGLIGFLAQTLNLHADAIYRIEAELGTLPKGLSTDVKSRLSEGESKASAHAASTANLTLPNPGGSTLTVDGVVMANGNRVLLKNQTTPGLNGVYAVSGIGTTVALDRTLDMSIDIEVADAVVSVAGGAINAETQWRQTTSLPLTLGTTALRWTRIYPSYTPFLRNPWEVGAPPALITNMTRAAATASVAQTAITALTSFHAGMVLLAGTTYTNINSFCTATGAGAVTLNHYGLIRLADRASLRSTANSTALPALGVYTRALSSALTVDVDTPVWVQWSTQVATTSPSFAGQAALTALVQPFALQAPIYQGNSTTTPTATPPADAAVLGAPTTATSGLVYFWLT